MANQDKQLMKAMAHKWIMSSLQHDFRKPVRISSLEVDEMKSHMHKNRKLANTRSIVLNVTTFVVSVCEKDSHVPFTACL